jgi:putative phage-type endonuclease
MLALDEAGAVPMNLAHPYGEHAELIVCETEADWLEARKSRLTASAAAAIVGKHPFKTRDDVLRTKISGSDFVPNANTWFGNAREESNIRIFGRLCGAEVETRVNRHLFVSKAHPFLAATLDGYVVRPTDIEEGIPSEALLGYIPERHAVVEAKNVRSKSRSYWNKDRMSPKLFMYWAQVQHQMLVTGAPSGVLFAAVDASEMYAHRVDRDEVFMARLIEEAEKFEKDLDALRF